MDQLPELREGTPEAQPEATPVRARKVKPPLHDQPALPRALEAQRKGLAEGWTWRIVFGQGYVEGTAPAPPPDPNVRNVGRREVVRKTVDVQIPVGSVTLRCAHVDGRRAVIGWVWRSDKETWAFSGPAYAWMAGMDARPYECDATEWRDLVRWVPELEAAA